MVNSMSPQYSKTEAKLKVTDESSSGDGSQDDKALDFFESNPLWAHERSNKYQHAKKKRAEQERLKGLYSNRSHGYNVQKPSRKLPDLNKVKPKWGGQYPANLHTFMFDNPVFENYVTNYMEDTQRKINE
jgi:hypothetical protein